VDVVPKLTEPPATIVRSEAGEVIVADGGSKGAMRFG
jgi:hypothetical protein